MRNFYSPRTEGAVLAMLRSRKEREKESKMNVRETVNIKKSFLTKNHHLRKMVNMHVR